MLFSFPLRSEVFGALKVYDVVRTLSLFGVGRGLATNLSISSFRELEDVAQSTAIVVPIRNEDLMAFEKVLRAIPYDSPIIVVSASDLEPMNTFNEERAIVRDLYKQTGRAIIHVHQRDPVLSELLKEESPELIDEKGLVRYGKGEGMLLGALLADGLRAKYVGFIDADNLIPGAVFEYSMIYYTMLSNSESKYVMVRVYWSYKGWAGGELFLRRMGRVSRVVGGVFNKLLSRGRVYETDIIKTSNSGEHAMSIELARAIGFSSGFSVECGELMRMIELCYIGIKDGLCPALPKSMEYYQVESLDPHIHAVKGDEHITDMLAQSLGVIYHSGLSDDAIRDEIRRILREFQYEGEPPRPVYYRYPGIDPRRALDELIARSPTVTALGI